MNKRLFQKRAKEALKAYTKEELQGIDLNNPTIETLEQIADMGGVSTDWLLGLEDKSPVVVALADREIRERVDILSGEELRSFASWSRNWMTGDAYTADSVYELYPEYKKGRRITTEEKGLLNLIYQKVIIQVLCGKR